MLVVGLNFSIFFKNLKCRTYLCSWIVWWIKIPSFYVTWMIILWSPPQSPDRLLRSAFYSKKMWASVVENDKYFKRKKAMIFLCMSFIIVNLIFFRRRWKHKNRKYPIGLRYPGLWRTYSLANWIVLFNPKNFIFFTVFKIVLIEFNFNSW